MTDIFPAVRVLGTTKRVRLKLKAYGDANPSSPPKTLLALTDLVDNGLVNLSYFPIHF